MSLADKRIIITGAGSGIGAAAALLAAAQGAHVALLGRRADALEQVAKEISVAGSNRAVVVPVDITVPADVDEAVTAVLDTFGGLDGLVNNAGIGQFAPIDKADSKDLQYMFDLHVRGPVQLIQRCLPQLREAAGSIVNVTSVAGELSAPNRSFYGATKAAMNHLTRSLAVELGPMVRVNAILPGPVDTPIYDKVGMSPERMREYRAELAAMTPMGRFGRSEEVGTWICHLLDGSAGWVTGVLLPIDGGRCA